MNELNGTTHLMACPSLTRWLTSKCSNGKLIAFLRLLLDSSVNKMPQCSLRKAPDRVILSHEGSQEDARGQGRCESRLNHCSVSVDVTSAFAMTSAITDGLDLHRALLI